jgi:hypothetical protein
MRLPACAIALLLSFGSECSAQSSDTCSDLTRLRAKASESWRQAQSAPASDRCAAYLQFSWADEALITYVKQNQDACNISAEMLDAMEAQRESADKERRWLCVRKVQPRRQFPPDKFQH